ncbi:MAG TPA: hypothetical protein VG275_07005 [Solirubrobacteraceae bacterium]|jgi:hypothetical protein|nr:hypothetical protein [Solirubrobacteraceae bacterium]
MPEYELIIDGLAMAEMLRSPAGPVGRMLIVRSTRVQARAREILGPHRRTGCLEDSLVKRAETFGEELAIRIQSDTTSCSESRTSYSLPVHEGSVAHDIPGAFGIPAPFGVGGRFEGKFHPANAPIPFLRDALPLALE